jgi:UDP-glucose 4-epimerase
MRIFVTGGTGFIGSHFLRAALGAGHEVRALRRPGSHPRVTLPRDPEWIEASLENVPIISLAGCDVLVHLAAVGVDGKSSWDDCFRVNVLHSLCLWQQAADAGVRCFVICGSCFEYGRAGERFEFIPVDAPLEPTGSYHASKAAATMAAIGLAVDCKLSLTVLRPFHVFGEGEPANRLWPSLRAAAREGQDLPITFGEQVRDFVEVEQVARRFLEASQPDRAPALGEPLIENVGSGRPQTIREFAEFWWKQWGAQGRLRPGAIPYRANEVMRYVPKI